MAEPSYSPVSALAGLPRTAGTGRGVIATEREGLGIARVTARAGQLAELQRLVRERFHLDLPSGPRRVCGSEVAAAGIGPESWLMICESADNAFAAGLRASFGGHAALVELSDAYVVLRLSGEKLRQSLAKLVPIDVHERSFRVGDVAQTVAEHMAVVLWRLEDNGRGEPVFELAAGRSFAASLYGAVLDCAAEFGCVLEPV